MINYAIKDNNKIINVIVAESKEIAESVTKLEAIEITPELPLGIDWELIAGVWTPPAYLYEPALEPTVQESDDLENVITLEEPTDPVA